MMNTEAGDSADFALIPGLVSILVPVYNRERYIVDCVRSAQAQTYEAIEIVIVDNRSDDGTWALCEQLAAEDPRVRVFRNESNIGPVRNWQRCAQMARGEFTKVLFSDDLLKPDCVERMVPALRDPGTALVFCQADIGESPETAVTAYGMPGTDFYTPHAYVEAVIFERAPLSPGALLMRTADFRAHLHDGFPTAILHPYDRHGAGPDVMVAFLTAAKYARVACVLSPLVFFRAHPGSFSIGPLRQQVLDAYRSVFAYFLFQTGERQAWLNFVALEWSASRLTQRGRLRLGALLKGLEGRGDVCEAIALCGSIVQMNWRRLRNLPLRIFPG
jgi:glycosyltransferase involved in cell wall biosynthesis